MYADSLSFWRDMKEYKLREHVYQSHSFIYNLKVLKFVFLLDIKKVSEGLAWRHNFTDTGPKIMVY